MILYLNKLNDFHLPLLWFKNSILRDLLLLLFILFSFQVWSQKSELDLKKLWGGAHQPERMEALRSMKDGSHFTVLEKEGETESSLIVSYAYADPKKKKVLFDAAQFNQLQELSDYSFSKNEQKLLIETAVDPIFRRSKQAIYWIYDLTTQKLEKLSEDKIQEPLFSPDGNRVAYVYRRNLYVKDLSTKPNYSS